MTLMVKGTLASEWSTMFWPTRLTYSVMTGSSMNLASRSTSAASCRPRATSLSSPPLMCEMMPLLMFRLPMSRGSSFSESGFPAPEEARCVSSPPEGGAGSSSPVFFFSFLGLVVAGRLLGRRLLLARLLRGQRRGQGRQSACPQAEDDDERRERAGETVVHNVCLQKLVKAYSRGEGFKPLRETLAPLSLVVSKQPEPGEA